MIYKSLCTDIDGTLLNKDRVLSEATIECFRKIKHQAIIFLASSRMPSAMRHLQEELGILRNPLICYNGGLVVDYSDPEKEGEILLSVAIPVHITELIVSLSQRLKVHVSLYQNDDWFVEEMDSWAIREENNTKVSPTCKKLREVISDWKMSKLGAHKVMCMGDEKGIDQMEQFLLNQHGEDLHIYRSRPTYLELANKKTSKASALEYLLEQKYDFTMSDVISFGDNFNDIELLQQCGFGVAVANAKEEVLAIADAISDTNKEDGVAKAVWKYFKLN